MPKKRLLYVDIIRITAVFFVVLIHVTSRWMFLLSPTSFDWQVMNIFNSMSRFCVPIFVMISGVFFLDPKRDFSMKKLLTKNIVRLGTALIAWTVVYAALTEFFSGRTVEGFLMRLYDEHYHLWYVYMIIGLYLLIPFLRKITENKKLTQYFLILGCIFALVIPFIASFPNLSGVAVYFGKFKLVFGYTLFFVAGYYFNTYTLSKRTRILLYIVSAVSVIFTIIATYLQSIAIGKLDETWYNYFLPTTACTALAVFLFIKSMFQNKTFGNRATKVITTLSACSFGIYLVHDLARVLLVQILKISYDFMHPIVSVPLITISCFILSFIIIFIISKIPVLNKYMI